MALRLSYLFPNICPPAELMTDFYHPLCGPTPVKMQHQAEWPLLHFKGPAWQCAQHLCDPKIHLLELKKKKRISVSQGNELCLFVCCQNAKGLLAAASLGEGNIEHQVLCSLSRLLQRWGNSFLDKPHSLEVQFLLVQLTATHMLPPACEPFRPCQTQVIVSNYVWLFFSDE